MPNKKTPASLPRQGGELTSTGLKVSNGRIYEETKLELRWPESLRTFKDMTYDPTISAAQTVIKAMIRNVSWSVDVVETTPSKEQQEQIDLIKSCMDDMTTSWSDFINEVLSMHTYGFSVHEKVYKRRKGLGGKTPSNFSDGKWGWKKLPVRSQDTITKWNYDDNGREILSVEQDLSSTINSYRSGGKVKKLKVDLPYNKILHFKHDSQRGNPEGKSPLASCHVPWRYKTTIEEFEAIGISRDLAGMPFVGLPVDYLSEDASDDKKAVLEYMKTVINNIHVNEQAGMIFPRFIDPETKQDSFEFKLISVEGSKQFDTDKVINRYENKILMTYLADVLKMGQDSVGSFALSDNKTNLLAVGIKAILNEILDVINRDLIPQTIALNGMKLDHNLPKISSGDLDDRDLEKLGKFIQQVTSVNAMEVDESLSDALRVEAKLPPVDRSKPISDEMKSAKDKEPSKAGEGGKTAGDGTSTSPSGGDSSASNVSNK